MSDLTDYEKYQLFLIAKTYERTGHTIIYRDDERHNVPFDALAINRTNGERVIIELVNAERSRDFPEERQELLARAAHEFADATVDFRYIDTLLPSYISAIEKEQRGVPRGELGRWLKRRLPPITESQPGITEQFMSLWALHVTTLSAFAKEALPESEHTQNVTEQYNHMLRNQELRPPEQSLVDLKLGFFDLYNVALSVTHGALASFDHTRQLRRHIDSIRDQIRATLKVRARQRSSRFRDLS